MTSISTARYRNVRRALVAVLGASALSAASIGAVTLSHAQAATGTDIGISQVVDGSTTTGETTVNVTVANHGSETAQGLVFEGFVTSTSKSFGVQVTGITGTCDLLPAPAPYRGSYTCLLGSIAADHTDNITIDLDGDNGVAFTSLLELGDFSPSDPNIKNNTSSLKTYYGPVSNLAVSQKVSARAKGAATIVSTTKNYGPSVATNLQFVVVVKGSGFKSIHSTGNCQFIPTPRGAERAAACTLPSLAPGKSWTMTFTYKGVAGDRLTQVSTATAQSPSDPAKANNVRTTKTKYGT
jgi:hypothetical protein